MNLKTISDKAMHFLAGMLVALVLLLATGSTSMAVFAAIVAGAGKEFYDWMGDGHVDPADFVFTGLGGVAVALAWSITIGRA